VILRAVPDASTRAFADACYIEPHRAARANRPTFERTTNIMRSIHDLFRRLGLTRPSEGRILGGVCAGLGRRIGLDPWPARLLFLLTLLVLPGCQLLVYPILWIVMPAAQPGEARITTTIPTSPAA
jgi:phage shock protein PspC (stress-responsive transcriptional regulator)